MNRYNRNNHGVIPMNNAEIVLYEELQANAFPALQTVQYDGWAVRFGGGFTYRVNCANPMYGEQLSAAEKIEYVEKLYQASDLSLSIFKLHQGMEALQLERCEKILEEKGYDRLRDGNIFVCDLESFDKTPETQVVVSEVMTDQWLDGFLTMNGTAETQRQAAGQMLKNIHYPIAAAGIYEDGRMIACGLGVIERGHVGLYDIFVDAGCRRRGLGGDICTAIMNTGKAAGCHKAYLQVLADNYGARALYRQLGYEESYGYWFRVKEI